MHISVVGQIISKSSCFIKQFVFFSKKLPSQTPSKLSYATWWSQISMCCFRGMSNGHGLSQLEGISNQNHVFIKLSLEKVAIWLQISILFDILLISNPDPLVQTIVSVSSWVRTEFVSCGNSQVIPR